MLPCLRGVLVLLLEAQFGLMCLTFLCGGTSINHQPFPLVKCHRFSTGLDSTFSPFPEHIFQKSSEGFLSSATEGGGKKSFLCASSCPPVPLSCLPGLLLRLSSLHNQSTAHLCCSTSRLFLKTFPQDNVFVPKYAF